MNLKLKQVLLGIAIITAIAVMICFPLIQLWALNTLFVAGSIPYTIWTYLAMMVCNVSTFGGLQPAFRSK